MRTLKIECQYTPDMIDACDIHVGFVYFFACFGKGESRQKDIKKSLHLDHGEAHPDA